MPETTNRYKLPSLEYLKSERHSFNKMLGNFAKFVTTDKIHFKVNPDRVDNVTVRVHQRKDYYLYFHGTQLEQSRQAAAKAYWILRYRPIAALVWDKEYDVNVYLAYFVLFSEALGKHLSGYSPDIQQAVVTNILNEYHDSFIRGFSEYNISKGAMLLVSDSIKSIVKCEIATHTA